MIKKKLLLVTRNFPPLTGGMEKLNFNIFKSLISQYDVSVAGPSGSSKFHKINSFTEFPVKPVWKFILFGLCKTVFFSLKVKPKIIFCGSGAAILAGYFSSVLTRASLVCYLHGLDIVVKSKIYQAIFLPLIKRSNIIFVNSRHTYGLAIAAGIDATKITILSPGADLPEIQNRVSASKNFRLKYGINDDPFLLIAGRITSRKGIAEFVAHAMPVITAMYPGLQLIIIGDEAVDAMKASVGVKEKVVAVANTLNLQKNIKLIGSVDDATLSAAYFSAEMLIFPVLDLANDVEGFGMVAIEAAAHGLPTVGFSVGGVSDAIADNRSGWLLSPGAYDEMSRCVLSWLSHDQNTVTSKSCMDYASEYTWEKFGAKLLSNLEPKDS